MIYGEIHFNTATCNKISYQSWLHKSSKNKLSSQVNRMVQSACLHLKNIGQVQNRLTKRSTKSLVQSLIISRLVYGNSLPIDLVTKLQLVQNQAAWSITLMKKRDHITPVLCSLHWLPVDVQINFKGLLMVYKDMHGVVPHYIH